MNMQKEETPFVIELKVCNGIEENHFWYKNLMQSESDHILTPADADQPVPTSPPRFPWQQGTPGA
jgi:hypothetical protein